MDDFGDVSVGLTDFDIWMTTLYFAMFEAKFLDIENIGCLDREHWKQYYDVGMTPGDAFEEDLTAWGD